MHCPNCRHILIQVELDSIEIEHCNNCGGSLFEPNEINRITLKDAQKLALMKQTDVISAAEKISPRDGSPFERIDKESIPKHVTLLQSKSTGEVFAFADDLVAFKEAQDAKIDYYKAWHIPMPPIKNVLVFSFAVFASATLAYMVTLLQSPATQSIQAQTLCEGGIGHIPLEDGSGHVVSCTTEIDLDCQVTAVCSDGTPIHLTCNNKTYFGTTPESCSQVKFIYVDGGQSVETEWEFLTP